MTDRNLLKDLPAAIASRWGSADNCPCLTQLQALDAALRQHKKNLKQLKQEKQACARAFGEAKQQQQPLAPLKAKMQAVAGSIKETENTLRETEQAMLALLSEPDADTTPRPEWPAQFSWQLPPVSSAECQCITVDEQQRELWQRYVQQHPAASQYHDYRWRDIFHRAFGHPSLYLAAIDSAGNWRGVLPLFRLRSRLFGDFMVSLPFVNYGGVLADNQAIADALLAAAAEQVSTAGLDHLELRSTAALSDWPHRDDKVSMILPLPETADTLWQQIGSKVRAQINRAPADQLETRFGGLELLDDYYRVFARNMRDLGTPVYDRGLFREILQTLPEQATLAVVYYRGKPVGTGFLLGHREMLEIPWASTLKKTNTLNVNMYMYWQILRFAIEKQYAFFDFGRSTRDAGTFQFKKQWGAKPQPHYWYYHMANGQPLPALKPDNPKFKLLIAIWQRLPVALTNRIGPAVVKYLP